LDGSIGRAETREKETVILPATADIEPLALHARFTIGDNMAALPVYRSRESTNYKLRVSMQY